METAEELTDKEISDIFALTTLVKAALRKTFKAEGFNFAWNEGKDYGQSVPHFHLHVVPRSPGDEGITEYEPRKFLYRPGSREDSPETELAAVAAEISQIFKNFYIRSISMFPLVSHTACLLSSTNQVTSKFTHWPLLRYSYAEPIAAM